MDENEKKFTIKKKAGTPGPGVPKGTKSRNAAITVRARENASQKFMRHADEALAALLEVMRDPDQEAAPRINAAKEILNRAYGKPVTTNVLEDNRQPSVVINQQVISQLPADKLDQLLGLIDEVTGPTKVIENSDDDKKE